MNPTSDCCSISYSHTAKRGDLIVYCPLHAEAPTLLALLKEALTWLEGLDPEANKASDGLGKIRATIAHAEGRHA